MTRTMHSIDEIKDMLLGQVEAVVDAYAPAAPGSYTDKGLYFTLNPGRVDKSVGSFCVRMTGAKAGNWNDYATGGHGDILDLLALAIGKPDDMKAGFAEALLYLGLETESPEAKRLRENRAAQARKQREIAAKNDKAERVRKARQAHGLWLSGQEKLRGTPVDQYLRQARGIDLSALGRQPRALRFHPSVYYHHMDKKTGEVVEGQWPAMLATITDARGNPAAVHRTWLSCTDGRWDKAPLPATKKVLGDYAGASIHMWSGIGARGGKGKRLSECDPHSHVFITEGIEDALSCIIAVPEARVIAAISLSNLGQIVLPENVTRVTLVADRDENDQAKAALQRAIDTYWSQGRRVHLWQNGFGGKDLNDALRAAYAAKRAEDAA